MAELAIESTLPSEVDFGGDGIGWRVLATIEAALEMG